MSALPGWYWDVSGVVFVVGCVVEVVAAFALAFVAAITIGYRDEDEQMMLRWLARTLTLAPLVFGFAFLAWPLVFAAALFIAGRTVFRLAWIEPADEKAARLRRERDERDREIRRLEREVGIR